MLSDDEQAAFLDSIERVRQRAVTRLGPNRDISIAINFVANLHHAVDKVMQQTGGRVPTPECTAGCAYCCSVRVEATEPEIFRIAREIKTRPTKQINALLGRLQEHAATAATNGSRRTNCAFLEDNLCSIYEVRPAVCRKAHSLSAQHCENQAPEIPQNLEMLLGTEALIKGTSDAYRQVHFHASAHELCHAMLLALTEDTAETRWHHGEAVFPAGHAPTLGPAVDEN